MADKPRDVLAREAARLKAAESRKLQEVEELRAQRAALESALSAMDEALAKFAAAKGLTDVTTARKVSGNMVTDRRLAISKGRTGKDKFASAYRAKGYTLRSLAEKVGCSHTMLSMHRAEDGRPIPQERAEEIAKLLDWPADKSHWPNGIS